MPAKPALPQERRSAWFSPGFVEAVGFWERGRVLFNLVQLVVAVAVTLTQLSDAHFIVENIGSFLGLALSANVLYCFAYVTEIFLQIPSLRSSARSVRICWWILGTVCACFLTWVAMSAIVLADPAND